MMFILRLLAAPFALAVILLSAVLAFLHSISRIIFVTASGLMFPGSVILLVSG